MSIQADWKTSTSADQPRRNRFEPGQVVGGRYRIIGPIRSGRLDEAYEIEEIKTRAHLSLRVLRRSRRRITPGRALIRSCRKLASLQHPNVARVHDVVVHTEVLGDEDIETTVAVTTDLIAGEPLSSFVRKERPLDAERARSLIEGICGGLAAIHRKGLVHGDLSGVAVVVVSEGHTLRPVITDFALSFDGSLGVRMGSPVYRAPEIIVGRSPEKPSDVFSLGAIMYEVLSGRIPFKGGNLLALDFRNLDEDPISLKTLVADVDPILESVVSRCLERTPEDRYANAGEVLQAVRGVDTPTPRTRRNVTTLGAAALLVAIMFGGSALLNRIGDAERARTTIDAPLYRPSFAILDLTPMAGTEPWIATGLSALIRDDFSCDGALRIADPILVRKHLGAASALRGMPDETLLAWIKNFFDVDAIIVGSCSTDRSADVTSVTVDLCVIDPKSGETVAAAFERGSPESLPELAARTVLRLRETIGLPESELVSTSWDPDAVLPWATGMMLLEQNRARDALVAMQKAADIQPENPWIHEGISKAWTSVGSAPRATIALRRAIDLSRGESPEKMLERRAALASLEGNLPDAIEHLNLLSRNFPDRVEHSYRLIDLLIHAGAMRLAAEEIRRLRMSRPSVDPRTEIMEARLHSRIGRFEDARSHLERAVAIAEASGSLSLREEALVERARVMVMVGDLESALDTLDDAEAATHADGDGGDAPVFAELRADILQRMGRLEAAFEIHARLLDWYEQTGQDQGWAAAVGSQARILALQGRHREARILLDDATVRFAALGDDANLARSLGVSGEVNLALGNIEEARTRFSSAVEVAARSEIRVWEGYAHLGLAKVSIEELKLETAASEIDQTASILRSLATGTSAAALDLAQADLDRLRGRLRTAENRLAAIATTGRDVLDAEVQAEVHLSLAAVTLESDRDEMAYALAMRALDHYSIVGNIDRQAECLTIAYSAAAAGDETLRLAIANQLDALLPALESPLRLLRLRIARAAALDPAQAAAEYRAVVEQSSALGLELVRLEAASELRNAARDGVERERWTTEVRDLVARSGARLFLAGPE